MSWVPVKLVLASKSSLSPTVIFVTDRSKAMVLMWFSVACFRVRVSVMFHLMFVHYTFSSVLAAEWPPIGGKIAAHSVGHLFSLSFACL